MAGQINEDGLTGGAGGPLSAGTGWASGVQGRRPRAAVSEGPLSAAGGSGRRACGCLSSRPVLPSPTCGGTWNLEQPTVGREAGRCGKVVRECPRQNTPRGREEGGGARCSSAHV